MVNSGASSHGGTPCAAHAPREESSARVTQGILAAGISRRLGLLNRARRRGACVSRLGLCRANVVAPRNYGATQYDRQGQDHCKCWANHCGGRASATERGGKVRTTECVACARSVGRWLLNGVCGAQRPRCPDNWCRHVRVCPVHEMQGRTAQQGKNLSVPGCCDTKTARVQQLAGFRLVQPSRQFSPVAAKHPVAGAPLLLSCGGALVAPRAALFSNHGAATSTQAGDRRRRRRKWYVTGPAPGRTLARCGVGC